MKQYPKRINEEHNKNMIILLLELKNELNMQGYNLESISISGGLEGSPIYHPEIMGAKIINITD